MNKREQMKRQRRHEIVQVAKRLILNKGIQKVQLQDIANEVGIGIATFYRYFPNKELIILAVHTDITAEMTAAIQDIAGKPITAYEMIEKIIMYYIELAEDPEHKFVKYMEAFDAYTDQQIESEEYAKYVATKLEMANTLYSVANKGYEDQSVNTSIDLAEFIFTAVHNISNFTVESYLTKHDEHLPIKLEPRKQLLLMKEIFLEFVRPLN